MSATASRLLYYYYYYNYSSTLLTISLLLLLMNPPHNTGVAADAVQTRNQQMLSRFMDSVIQCSDLREVGVSVVKEGRVQHELAYHVEDQKADRSRMDTDTVFCLGGSTQAFTAVLLAVLLNDHQNFTIDTPVREIVGYDVPLPGEFRSRHLNLRDVLGMRAGLSNMDIVAAAKGMTREGLMRVLRYAPEISRFREKDVYNEVLFSLAEEAARALGDDSWENLVRRHVFDPLGMSSASFVYQDETWAQKMAKPYLKLRGEQRFTIVPREAFGGQEAVAAATSVCASVSDLSKWMNFILTGGKIPHPHGDRNREYQLVGEDVIRSTFDYVQIRDSEHSSPRSQGFPQHGFTRVGNALGWIKGQYRGNTFVSQDGSLPGFESLSLLLPSRQIGVFTTLTGVSGGQAYAVKVVLSTFALDVVLSNGTSTWVRAGDVCEILGQMTRETEAADRAAWWASRYPRPQYASKDEPLLRPAEEYEGTYRNYAFGDVLVSYNVTKNLMTLQYGELGHYQLYQSVQNDTFLMQAPEAPLWYSTHAKTYADRGPFLAIFGNPRDDPSLRVETLTIPHFARDMDPVFSKHPGPPPDVYSDRGEHGREEGRRGDCDGAGSLGSGSVVASVFLAVAFVYVFC